MLGQAKEKEREKAFQEARSKASLILSFFSLTLSRPHLTHTLKSGKTHLKKKKSKRKGGRKEEEGEGKATSSTSSPNQV